MADLWIAPTQIFDGDRLQTGLGLRVSGGIVTDMAVPPADARSFSGTLSPGFVDLQVNGGGGVMVNSSPTRAGLLAVGAAHHALGTVAILPTVITDAPDVLGRAADAAIKAKEDAGHLGLHIEGPHIARGRRGTHAEKFVRPFDEMTMTQLSRLCDAGVLVMLTLAPEVVDAETIASVCQMGVHVSVGHTDATAEQVNAAISAGARFGTHLYNAMSGLQGRAPGAIGALINSDCYTGIICDGHHVRPDMIAMAHRARAHPDRMFLVSDAMPTVGGPDHFDLYGQRIKVQGGRLVNRDGNLAGAHISQAQGVKGLVHDVGLSLQDALRMAVSIPAQAIGRPELAKLEHRRAEDLVLLTADLTFAGSVDAWV